MELVMQMHMLQGNMSADIKSRWTTLKEIAKLQCFCRYQPFIHYANCWKNEKVAVTYLAIVIATPNNDQLLTKEKVSG